MARLLLVLLALCAFGLTGGPAFGQERLPRINPLTGKPFGPKAIAEYEAELKQIQAEEETARQVSDEAQKRWEEARARNADRIKAFDDAVEAWRKSHPAPAGTRESLVSTSYDGETALPEDATITYFNGADIPTHTISFGPDGKPTGPVTLTQQGKAWETIGPHVPPGGLVEYNYDRDFDGNEIIKSVRIADSSGRVIARYDFNFDGVAWRGETRDGETGLRNGGFQDDRLRPPPVTVGGPLPVPAKARFATGLCEACRALTNEHNDVAQQINAIVAEMAQLSEQNQHALPPAQKPIRMRYAVLEKQLADLTARLEDLHARLLTCAARCQAAEPTVSEALGTPPAAPPKAKLPEPALSRPQFERVPDLTVPARFCSEFERNDYLTGTYNPAVAAALHNATVAQEHQARLNALFTQYMQANSEYWGAVRAERDAWEPIAAAATAKAESLRQLYAAIMAVPVAPCAETTTPPPPPPQPVDDGPADGPGDLTGATPDRSPASEKPCPPKEGRDPITVGPNSKVGSGAQLRSKVGGMAMGALMGALGAGGGGGGGSDGPDLWTCKIKESEYTVFDDPATGVSLRVGAKRAKGGKVVIFSEIARSPDKGTFQTAFLENPTTGETQAPSDAGPCDLWGEWKLTVSWTKTTYVNGQVVDRQSGGWSKSGLFSIPGALSKADAPDGLWKRMGFSSASNGAREIGMIYNVPPGGGPLTFVIHVTRPRGDPVTTVPFVLTLTEGPNGFVFTRAEDPPCPPDELEAPGPDFGKRGTNFGKPGTIGYEAPPPPLPISEGPVPGAPTTPDSRPRPGTPEYDQAVRKFEAQIDQDAENLVDQWIADDLKLLDELTAPGACPDGVRQRLADQIRKRMRETQPRRYDMTTGGPRKATDVLDYRERANLRDRARAEALLDWLSDDPQACRPPGTVPPDAVTKPAHFDAAPAPYTEPPSDEKPGDSPM